MDDGDITLGFRTSIFEIIAMYMNTPCRESY